MIPDDLLAAVHEMSHDDVAQLLAAAKTRVGDASLRQSLNTLSSGQDAAAGAPAARDRTTDNGNANRFVDRHADTVRYDHTAKRWFVWDKVRWQEDYVNQAQELAKETILSIYAEAAACPDSDRREVLAKHARASDKAKGVVDILRMGLSLPEIRVTARDWDKSPWLLNVANGTLDLKTGTLQPHDRKNHLTKLAPVDYDPDAKCPTWDACMTRWQPDENVRAFLQRAAGYSLTGDIGEETAFFTFGNGRNGKSKFTGALAGLMGDYAARVNIQVLMDNQRTGNATPELIPLIGARLVIASEIQEARRLNESFIKDITGGDAITARRNYGDTFEFSPTFKLWLYGNHKPIIKGTDEGIWSRFPFIPFTVHIPVEDRDPDLADKLQSEWSGILAWAVRGCLLWQQERLQPPAAVLEATAAYREEMDTSANFFTDCCVLHSEAWVSAHDLRVAYDKWAQEQGDRRPLSPNAFGERLQQAGAVAARARREGRVLRIWKGIGLISDKGDTAPEDLEMTSPEGAKTDRVYTVNTPEHPVGNSPHDAHVGEVTQTGVTGVHGVHNDPIGEGRARANTTNTTSYTPINKEIIEEGEVL